MITVKGVGIGESGGYCLDCLREEGVEREEANKNRSWWKRLFD